MGNKLLINGSLFQGRTDIQSWTTEQQQGGGGVEVNWGEGDIDILSGDNYSITNQTYKVFECSPSCQGLRRGLGYAYPINEGYSISYTRVAYSSFYRYSYYSATITNTETGQSWIFPATNDYYFQAGSVCSNRVAATYNFPRIKVSEGSNFTSYHYKDWQATTLYESFIETTVTTNAGQKSTRRNKPPSVSVLSTDCVLTITYTDGKTQTLTYPECPTVSLVEEEVCDQACILADRINAKLGS